MHVPSRGVTLIDAVVGVALMAIAFAGIAAAFHLSLAVIINNKARAGAIALANERMEYIRSLPYASVGTVNGVPAGTIPQTETVTLNATSYTRRTYIAYGDDPKDGLGGSDTNSIPTDFKYAKVEVTWDSVSNRRDVTLLTRVTPTTGMETNTGGGTLTVNVTNAAGAALPDAIVRVVNLSLNPDVDVTTFTNASGTAKVLGAPAGAGYQIIVSETGYSTAQTYSSSATNTSPTPANATVTAGNTTAATLSIDLLGDITVQTFGYSGTTTVMLPNIAFQLTGAKIIGTGPSGTNYKYSTTQNSGASGSVTIPNLEWDSYTVTVPASSGYDVASSCSDPQPRSLAPNGNLTESIYLRPHTTNSLLVDARSAATGVLLPNAYVVLTRTGFTATSTTDACGQAFFSGLTAGSTYTAAIGLTGYATSTNTNVNVSGASRLSDTL